MADEEELNGLMRLSTDELQIRLTGRDDIPPATRKALVLGAKMKDALKSQRIQDAFNIMLGCRQAYIAGYRELTEAGEDMQLESEVFDAIVQVIQGASSKPFSEHQLMDTLMATTLPSLANLVDRHADQDVIELQKIREQVKEERKNDNIPFIYSVNTEAPETLSRSKSLTLVAHREAANALANLVVRHVREKRPDLRIMLLCDGPSQAETIGKDLCVPFVSAEHWRGIGNKRKDAQQNLEKFSLLLDMKEGPDLMICMDLAAVFTAGFTGRPAEANAGDGHRTLWEFCRAHQCALLGFVSHTDTRLEEFVPDTSNSFFEQLRLFSQLETVTWTTDNDKSALLCSPYNHSIEMCNE